MEYIESILELMIFTDANESIKIDILSVKKCVVCFPIIKTGSQNI